MINILICDDETVYLNELSFHVREYMNLLSLEYFIHTSSNPADILSNHTIYDLALLDIQMNETSGISLAKELKKRNNKLILFFVTNYEKYQDDAMDLHALRYLSKPVNVQRLHSGIDRALEYIDKSYIELYLNTTSLIQRVSIDDIMYFTRERRHVLVQTVNSSYILRGSYDEWCSKIPSSFFYHVHKSFFVNLHYVQIYEYSLLTLTNQITIPIAPRKQSAFHKYWFSYLRRQ